MLWRQAQRGVTCIVAARSDQARSTAGGVAALPAIFVYREPRLGDTQAGLCVVGDTRNQARKNNRGRCANTSLCPKSSRCYG